MSDCILWTGYVQSGGYGQRYHKGKRYLAHRWAWMQVHGPIPEGMCICHHCDTPLCINVEHLFLGTPRDNTRDAMQKGRMKIQELGNYTRQNRRRKLTDADVAAIRASPNASLKSLAAAFNVSVAHISLVRRGYRKVYLP